MSDWTLLGLPWWKAIFAAALSGGGCGLLGLGTEKSLGVWCLWIAARIMLRP